MFGYLKYYVKMAVTDEMAHVALVRIENMLGSRSST